MKFLLSLTLVIVLQYNCASSEVRFFGPESVKPDKLQQEMIALSIEALIDDCQIATRLSESRLVQRGKGLTVKFSRPVEFNGHVASWNPKTNKSGHIGKKIEAISKIVIRLPDNATNSMRMHIYAYTRPMLTYLGNIGA